jgi:hypothetical protein
LFDELAERRVLRHDPDDDPVEVVALPAAPVAVVLVEDGLLLRGKGRHPVRAGAHPFGAGLGPGVAPVAVLLVLLGQPGVDDVRAVGRGDRRLEEGLRPPEVEDHRPRVRRRDLRRVGHEAADDLVRAKPEGEQPLERRLDGRRVARRAVVERGPFAEVEGPDALVGVRLPALGQERHVLVRRVALEPHELLVRARR